MMINSIRLTDVSGCVAGSGRRVRCFYCGLELDHFAPGDNVWDEHVRYRPTCPYLVAIMGQDLVLRTQIRLGSKP